MAGQGYRVVASGDSDIPRLGITCSMVTCQLAHEA